MVKIREFKILKDFEKIYQFLNEQYKEQGFIYPLAPMFEYALTHCCFNYMAVHRFRIWEDDGAVVGLAGFEIFLGEAFVLADKNYEYLYHDMLDYAEKNIAVRKDNENVINIKSKQEDQRLTEQLLKRGYIKKWSEPRMYYSYEKGFNHNPLPVGYEMFSLNEENDIEKWDECLWRGFDHGTKDEYTKQLKASDLDERATMQSGPNFKKDLAFVIKSESGDYVCVGNLWIDNGNDYAYLDPLATVPEHRRKGLAKILLMEAMKASVKYGAKYCIGGSIEYYQNIGFEKVSENIYWEKRI